MTRVMTVCASLIVLMLMASDALAGQHQASGQMQMGGQAGQQMQPPGPQPMMGAGMMGPGMMGMMCPMMGMMPMMQQMMGGQMDPSGMSMMGMMAGGAMDPKAMARMLQLRGEMLKAMSEVLLKHGKAMEEGR